MFGVQIIFLVFFGLLAIQEVDSAEYKEHPREKRAWKIGVTAAERVQFLNAHNGHRRSVSPTASNMRKMYYSSELEKSAQEWSNTCQYKHGNPDWIIKKYTYVGQNIWKGTAGAYSVQDMVDLWNAEKVDYNLASNTCNANKVCGHYTQEVWASSYKVGCGMTQCANLGNLQITVCNYLEVGNFNKLPPYTSGASCSACPSAAPTCEDGLCAITNNVCSVVEPDCNITDTTNCLCDNSAYTLSGSNLGSGAQSQTIHLPTILLAAKIAITIVLPYAFCLMVFTI